MIDNKIIINLAQIQYLDMQNCSKNEQINFNIFSQYESSNAAFLHLFSSGSLSGVLKGCFLKFGVGKHFQGFF